MILTSTFSFKTEAVYLVVNYEKLPTKASNQLPEFFQEDFPTFQKFIDLYYQYQQNSRSGYLGIESIKDIDEIGRKYLEAFYGMYGQNIPEFPYISMADFIRNAKRFYVSRGSEESFKFLFRVMFGLEIDFKYPKENILRSSSGKWNQKVSLYLKVLSGEMDDYIVGRRLKIKGADGSTTTLIVNSVEHVVDDIWEIEVDKFVQQVVSIGDRVFAKQNAKTLAYSLICEVTSTLNSFAIIDGGSDFKIGEIFEVSTPVGNISIRIAAVEPIKGSIKRIEFLSFAKNEYNLNYDVTLEDASIQFKSTSINRYAGYYENTDGFLSNNNKLHDNYFYQIFSYVIKSKVSRDLYEDLTLKILHPSGLIMFSEYEQGSDYDITIEFQTTAKPIIDVVDFINTYDTFSRNFIANRTINDNISITENVSKKIIKNITDSTSLSDVGELKHWEASDYTVLGYTSPNLYTTNGLNEQVF